MWAYTEDERKWLETPRFQADPRRTAALGQGETAYYVDVARRMRAEAMATLLRQAVAAVARSLHLGPASRGATPRAV